jgi:hypothetical protein
MGKKKNKSNKKVILTDWKDWAGVSPFSTEMQLIRKTMGDTGDFTKLITANKPPEIECQHKMTVIHNGLYLDGEFLIERYCVNCGFKQIRFDVYDKSGHSQSLTDWIDCKKVE